MFVPHNFCGTFTLNYLTYQCFYISHFLCFFLRQQLQSNHQTVILYLGLNIHRHLYGNSSDLQTVLQFIFLFYFQ